MDAIVITGIGTISPLGFSKEEFWQGLVAGHEAMSPGTIQGTDGVQERQLGRVAGFKAKKYIKRPVLKPLDMVTRYAIAGVGEALADANFAITENNRKRTAIIAGSMYQGIDCIFKFKKACFENGLTHLSPLFFPGIVFNSLSGQAAIEHQIQGPNNTVSNGTGSGLMAVSKGLDYLLANKADTVIAGGAEMIHDFIFYKYDRLGHLASAQSGQENGRPFATGRNGFILGEGSCFFVMERQSAAKARGAKILAHVDGYGAAYCPDPDQGAQAQALAGCMKRSQPKTKTGNKPDLIVCDSSGAKATDAIEAQAISSTYGTSGPLLSGNKANIGHSLGASGVFNLCQGILSMQHNQVSELKGLEKAEYDLNYATETITGPINQVTVNSVDFGCNYLSMSVSKDSTTSGAKA